MSEQTDIFAPAALVAASAAATCPIETMERSVVTPSGSLATERFGYRFRFTVPGEPVAKGRPRIGNVRGRAMAFTPAKTRSYENEIRHYAKEAWGDKIPLDGLPLTLFVDVYRSIPASLSKKKRELALSGVVRPLTKPDCSNYGKSAEDALNSVIFRDDCLIVETTVRKWYAETPRLEVELCW